jgi:hypothetical protein
MLYVYCVDVLIYNPTQLDFPFYDFSVIYYDFSKLLQRVICPVLESSGGKKSIFIGWEVMYFNPHKFGVKYIFWALLAPGRPEGRGPPDGRRAVRSTVGVRCATVALKKKSRKKSRRNIRPYCMQHDEGNSQHSKATSATFKK